jgi:hypothetical protein
MLEYVDIFIFAKLILCGEPAKIVEGMDRSQVRYLAFWARLNAHPT